MCISGICKQLEIFPVVSKGKKEKERNMCFNEVSETEE